jgi:hypothetical protein
VLDDLVEANVRIERDQTFADIPAGRVTDMMRGLRSGELLGVEYVQQYLGVLPRQAKTLIAELERQGFIEPESPGSKWWGATLKGSALALATAAKPIRRRSAEAILERFLERVHTVRIDPTFLWRVERVDLFGSLAAARETVNDIDLGIELRRKEEDIDPYHKLANELRRSTAARGRQFKGDADWISWPSTHVMLFLKSRSRALSLHPLDDWVIAQAGRQTIYLHHNDALGQTLLFESDGRSS